MWRESWTAEQGDASDLQLLCTSTSMTISYDKVLVRGDKPVVNKINFAKFMGKNLFKKLGKIFSTSFTIFSKTLSYVCNQSHIRLVLSIQYRAMGDDLVGWNSQGHVLLWSAILLGSDKSETHSTYFFSFCTFHLKETWKQKQI